MANVQTLPEPDDTDADLLARYKEEIKYYEKEAQAWEERARKILRRYKDERSPREARVPRFNILYSNIQTLLPAIYGKNPKADIERRFKDKDPLGRVTSDVLERCTDYFCDTEAFRSSLRAALFDRLTAGRGTTWTRYVPHFRDAELQGEETDGQLDDDMEAEDDVLEEVYYEEANTDYVPWPDLGHNWARIWDEIYIGWRKVYLTRKEMEERFGEEIAALVPLDYAPKGLNDQKKETTQKKAVIYECWDKQDKMVRWLHKDVSQWLDEKEDPLKLPDFFPFPKPLYSILANDSMIPVPDYIEYQDQANELDEITSRIGAITKALKVAGVYDASASGVERLLAEGVENKMIPVEQWAVHSEKGGLKGVMDFLPIETIAKTMMDLYDAREKVKQDLYEITGIADILRGQSDPNETATAVNTKGRFATLRLGDSQDEMARFARDAVKNVAVVIANHFSMDTIKKISGVKLLTAAEKMQIQMQMQQQAQMAQQQAMMQQPPAQPGQPPAPPPQVPKPPPIDDDLQELLDNPTWEEVEQLLRDEPGLCFKIDIETNSTIKMDEEAEKASRVEFLKAAGQFMASMQTAPPVAQPLLAHMLMFGVRGFSVSREIESQFEIFAAKLEKQAASAPANPPSPEMLKVQAQQQQNQAELAMKQKEIEMTTQQQAANDQRDAQREDQRMQLDHQYKIQEMQQDYALKMKEMEMNADLDMKKHAITQDAASKPQTVIDVSKTLEPIGQQLGQMAQTMVSHNNEKEKALNQVVANLANHVETLHKHATKPKTVTMQGRDGRTLQATVQ